MPIGMILLIVIALLILFGVLQRTLDRMALTDRQALLFVSLLFIGGWLPDLNLGPVIVNIGGAVIPLGICIYLFFHAGTAKERGRCLFASVLSAAAITAVSWLFPADPTAMPFDPLLIYGAAGGVIAWLLGRSRRSAFIAGILGVIIADIVGGVSVLLRGINQPISLGGAGAADAIVISGVTAVMLCELVGEVMERMKTGKASAPNEDGAIEGGARA